MSFNQLSPEDTSGVAADSFFATSPLQHMSRRRIMSLNVKIVEIVGLAPDSLFGAISANRAVLDQEKNVSATLFLYLQDEHRNITEFPEHYYAYCTYSNLPVGATV